MTLMYLCGCALPFGELMITIRLPLSLPRTKRIYFYLHDHKCSKQVVEFPAQSFLIMQDSLFSLLIRPTVWAFCKLNFHLPQCCCPWLPGWCLPQVSFQARLSGLDLPSLLPIGLWVARVAIGVYGLPSESGLVGLSLCNPLCGIL